LKNETGAPEYGLTNNWLAALRQAEAAQKMPPDVAAQVRALLRQHPDQRGYILDELRWKDWRIDGL